MARAILAYLLLLILISTSCTTTGHFTSNPRERMAHAGNEFILTKSDSFQLRSWTDNYSLFVDDSGNRIWKENRYRGEGIYQRNGDSLHLKFTSSDSILVKIIYAKDDTIETAEISFFDELGEPINIQFQVENNENEILRSVQFPRNNIHFLSFQINENPTILKLSGFGLNVSNPNIDFKDLKLGLNEIKLKTYNGYFAYSDTLNIWFKPTFTGIRYEFRGRKRYLPKKWGIKFLNGLYRDY